LNDEKSRLIATFHREASNDVVITEVFSVDSNEHSQSKQSLFVIMSKTLVIVGATGSQGRAVIKYFQSQEPSWSIRGLTRNPTSESAVTIAKSGVDVVKADLDDVESLKGAFSSANYIFAYTDFGGIVQSPEVIGKFQAGELAAPIGAEAYRIEVQHGKNIADAAASIPELERLVWSALPGVRRLSKGRYERVFHFDAKADAFEYMMGIESLQGKASAIHLGAFMTNAITGLDLFKLRKVVAQSSLH